ncbi:transposon ty3-I gag-pol polyprotein [Tanacetum coccineum]|uniref:Transposon ty3-I gag-pol polyprotein n=1 Tax=Tanacetum coccineum TaxID=301880 RepID=A0ABQ4WXQ7_9ASTR
MAKRLGCNIRTTCPLTVTLVGGNHLVSDGECKDFKWHFGNTLFTIDIMLLPLGGCDMVLGIQWLATLGDIKCNFKELRMEFKYNGKGVALRGTQKTNVEWMGTKAAKKALKQVAHAEFHSMALYVFAVTIALPPLREHDHRIPLIKEVVPVNIRPYKPPPAQKDGIESMVKELKLNKQTVKDKFPILIIEELIDELHGAKVFTKLDLRSGYHQRMYEKDIAKTAFRTHEGHYEFLTVVETMRQNSLYAKKSKCMFGTPQVEYLGHVISSEGIATEPSKITAMTNWPIPVNIKQLREFLGLTGYYRRFIKGYATISKPLTKLLKKNIFAWTTESQLAFEKLKEAMVTAPVLRMPDFSKEFTIETNASRVGLGSVLLQEGHPIAFLSKTLSSKHQLMSTYEKEFLAIVQDLEKWRGYLLDRHFKIKTDHFSLKYLLDQRMSAPAQLKWLPKLMGFDYEIQYKKKWKMLLLMLYPGYNTLVCVVNHVIGVYDTMLQVWHRFSAPFSTWNCVYSDDRVGIWNFVLITCGGSMCEWSVRELWVFSYWVGDRSQRNLGMGKVGLEHTSREDSEQRCLRRQRRLASVVTTLSEVHILIMSRACTELVSNSEYTVRRLQLLDQHAVSSEYFCAFYDICRTGSCDTERNVRMVDTTLVEEFYFTVMETW